MTQFVEFDATLPANQLRVIPGLDAGDAIGTAEVQIGDRTMVLAVTASRIVGLPGAMTAVVRLRLPLDVLNADITA
jgi:hypothetical protein